jgi:hypothetical protein
MLKICISVALILFYSIFEKPKEFEPLKFAHSIDLKGYDVKKTFKLNEREFITIAQPINQSSDDFGLRLIYLKKENQSFKIRYISKGVGDSYIFRTKFFEFQDNTKLIFAELGFEYNYGVEVFELKDENIKYLGFVDVACAEDSIYPKLMIERKENKYFITFKGKIILYNGTDNKETIDGENIEYQTINDNFKIFRK